MNKPSESVPDPRVQEWIANQLSALHGYVRLNFGDKLRRTESSLDVVQSVCREALERPGRAKFSTEEDFRRWLFRVAETTLLDRGRYWNSRPVVQQDAIEDDATRAGIAEIYATLCTPSHVAGTREELERIEAAYDQLSQPQRDAIRMVRVGRYTTEEAGEMMGCTPAHVRVHVSRGLARLVTHLDQGPR